MKKSLVLVFAVLFLFSGCNFFSDDKNESVEPAKTQDEELKDLKDKIDNLKGEEKDLENEVKDEEKVEEKADEDVDEEEEVDEDVDEEKDVDEDVDEKISEPVEKPEEEPKSDYNGESFIKLTNPIDGAGFTVEPIIFKGEVSPNTEKIVVTQTYADDLSIAAAADVYTLQDFEYGDDEFVYRASQDWDNLNYGENYYEFKAYFDDETTKSTKVTIEFLYQGNGPASFIDLDKPTNGSEFYTFDVPIEFKGTVSANTTKIVVKAWQEEGYFAGYKDVYILQDFGHGDKEFVYRASKDWGNLARGPNNYEFTAHFDDGTTQTVSVSINYYDHAGVE